MQDVAMDEGDPLYRERLGDWRVLYVVRSNPDEVLIPDIDHCKDMSRMPNAKAETADGMQMKEADFDAIMHFTACEVSDLLSDISNLRLPCQKPVTNMLE
ncbi:hypothetical protein Q4610_08055 [Sphingobium sp. HBC34]|uniref:Uncharacterized protein n=1 Tax=Sphingobium cyanobacteriorum TaxID=3063954 RepID=A0ABT8ZNB3_9SPHN|nr:hypothetical protein [Sphingobium sp. HBC34]MDO7835001.1 hypothetical protein [Sphingobium sp. HBC34]